VAELGIRVQSIEDSQETQAKKTERAEKYTNNMLEDLMGRMGRLENSSTRFETNLQHVNGNGTSTNTRPSGIETRLSSIERLQYMFIGGFITVTGLVTFFGFQVLKILLK
jgi:hypothetical protein